MINQIDKAFKFFKLNLMDKKNYQQKSNQKKHRQEMLESIEPFSDLNDILKAKEKMNVVQKELEEELIRTLKKANKRKESEDISDVEASINIEMNILKLNGIRQKIKNLIKEFYLILERLNE